MSQGYEAILRDNLRRFFSNPPPDIGKWLGAYWVDESVCLRAFGEDCCLGPEEIRLSGSLEKGPKGILISLYAAYADPQPMEIEPLRSFMEFSNAMPYHHGAFKKNVETPLIPRVPRIREHRREIQSTFDSPPVAPECRGDFSFVLLPLPKVALCYSFYLPDEEFPASVTCLFSANASSFLPVAALADIAEYTSKAIVDFVDRCENHRHEA